MKNKLDGIAIFSVELFDIGGIDEGVLKAMNLKTRLLALKISLVSISRLSSS